ncbi:MAG: hypothetical protein V1647_07480, partial [Pseudomonadota bacterium]
MLFLNRKLLALVFIAAVSAVSYAVENPFSVNFDVDKKTTSEGTFQIIKVAINSRSGEGTGYFLKLNIPETNMKMLEGKRVYTGTLLKGDEFYIMVKGVSEGEGELSAKV